MLRPLVLKLRLLVVRLPLKLLVRVLKLRLLLVLKLLAGHR